jgi:hypothetical protein
MNDEQIKAIADMLKGAAIAQLVGFGYDGIQKKNSTEFFASTCVFFLIGLVVVLVLGAIEGEENEPQ